MTSKYIIFPPGEQPTHKDIDILNGCSYLFKGTLWKIGVEKETQRLMFQFDESAFESARKHNYNFNQLMEKWEAREETAKRIWFPDFKEDPTALHPVANEPQEYTLAPAEPREKDLHIPGDALREAAKKKRLDTRELIGRSKLETYNTAERLEAWGEFAKKWVPRVAVAGVIAAPIAVGIEFYRSIKNTNIERRRDTIERVVEDGMGADPHTRRGEKKADEAITPEPNLAEKEAGKKEAPNRGR